MFVLVIPSWYFDSESKEITGKNFHFLAHTLRDSGVDARIHYSKLSLDGPFKKKTGYQEESGVPTRRVSYWFPPKLNSTIIQWWIRRNIKEIMDYIKAEGKPDLIHAHSYQAGIVAMEIKRKLNIPYIYTEHLSLFLNDQIPQRYKKLIQHCLNAADTVTCVSPGLKIKLSGYTGRPIDLVPNFYNSSVFSLKADVKKPKFFTWIAAGEPWKVKGVDMIIEAYSKLKHMIPDADMKLIIIDEINGKNEVQKIATTYNVENSITWTGLISQEELVEYYQTSHVFVSASRIETFGTAMVEAQACGLPAIATKTAGSEFIIQSSEQGTLIETENADSMMLAMMEMMEKYERYNSETIASIIYSRFREEIVIARWKEIYAEVSG